MAEAETIEVENTLTTETQEVETETPETSEVAEVETPEVEAEPPKKSRDAESRIRELTAREKAAIEYAEYWRTKATKDLQPPKPAEPEEKPAPKLADFKGDTDKWSEAYSKWNDDRVERKAEAIVQRTTAKQREESTQAELQSQWDAQCADFAKDHPDFFDAINNPTLPISKTMGEVLQSSEKGAELAYHLATNPGEAARIARMGTSQQAAALGRLEAKLEKPAAPKKTTTKAPEPPTPVGGGGVSTVDIESMSAREYLDYKMKKAARR